ncbi:ScaI family restriction endonuclease [Lyngbya sp. CCY1209]|uniref:ScaI family restriction endonuclease n=1 Tax=Lyngbya sp. CCY1209 TaxID=2886103 RepID=UPI002D20698B|nr:ScaI family restriction endonuclease [Lyngbya sp. CCY1209]MEB3885858.1 ScaI family restriction endonuclease [Lyngbya sp. CCY1209]
MESPYEGIPVSDWESKTRELIGQHPLDPDEIYEVIVQVWREIFESNLTSRGYRIGVDLFPRPQIMGFFLHELIPLEFSNRYPGIWRREENDFEKDLVYLPNNYFSIEIKTSSSKRSTYGNRSYAQKRTAGAKQKKDKSGYYLVINFQKFDKERSETQIPDINLIRFGWIDFLDWQGQASATGQQARLNPNVEKYKLLKLPL